MASVCGGSLALMDSGVPIKSPVAGIAMGMLLDEKASVSDEESIILSDISGTEDAFGTMDFKVAGDRDGITTFQLDIKCEGLTLETMERALEQARVGRLHILDAMDRVMAKPGELPPTVPKMYTFFIPFDGIGKVIGPGGKQIRAIIEDFELSAMDVQDDGTIQLSSFNSEKMKEVEEFVKLLVGGGGGKGGGRGGGGGAKGKPERAKYSGPEPVIGQIYKGKITGIHNFGVFVEFMPGEVDGSTPGLEGLCHVSELARDRVRNCEGFIRSLGVEEIEVVYEGLGENGKVKLSRRKALEANFANSRRAVDPPEDSSTPPAMSEDELDVIARAIEGI
jgi:polyribonucleotide nucleotidyltransferase